MISYTPPPPILYAQVFTDPGNTFQMPTPDTNAQPTTSANTQRPVDTIAVGNYLKSKYIGIQTLVTDSERHPIGQGIILSVSKADGIYSCDFQNPGTGTALPVQVIFEGFVQDVPSRKRWAMNVASQIQDKRLLEAESQLSTMMSAIGSESTATAITPADRIPEPTADVLPPGEELQVLDIKTMKMAKQFVVIYKGNPFLSTGVPLNVRLEYQP